MMLSLACGEQTLELALEDQTDALCVERSLGEIAVVGLVVALYADVVGKEISDVEVADEVGGIHRVLAIAEVSVDEQAVVEETSFEDTFELHVFPVVGVGFGKFS